MSTQLIIDGDGHVVEDIATIWKYMPQEYVGRSFRTRVEEARFRPSITCTAPTAILRRRALLPTSAAKAGSYFSKRSASVPRFCIPAAGSPLARS